MCRKLSIFLLVLLLASFSLWAFPGRQTSSQGIESIVISDLEVPKEAQKTDSGNPEETISTEPQTSYAVQEATAKAEAGKRLTNDEVSAILAELDAARADYAALQDVSEKKDATIDELAKRADEAGTKAYIIVGPSIGFDHGDPDYGVGITLGTRLGNSLMLELGADYMLGGSIQDVMEYSLDNWTFRAGVGWMF